MKNPHQLCCAALALACALILISPARAGFKEGKAAFERGDYATALQEWRPLAEQGDAKAQYTLGVRYETGRGVPQDKVLAYALYNLSAAGDPLRNNIKVQNRDRIAPNLSNDELMEGQALTRELAKPGNFAKALETRAARKSTTPHHP